MITSTDPHCSFAHEGLITMSVASQWRASMKSRPFTFFPHTLVPCKTPLPAGTDARQSLGNLKPSQNGLLIATSCTNW